MILLKCVPVYNSLMYISSLDRNLDKQTPPPQKKTPSLFQNHGNPNPVGGGGVRTYQKKLFPLHEIPNPLGGGGVRH